MSAEVTLIVIAVLVVLIFFVCLSFIPRWYVRCPANKVLVVWGKGSKDQGARCVHGGAHIVWPIVQDAAFLDLTPMTINIPLRGALSIQNIRVNVPSTFTIKIDHSEPYVNIAARSLLGLTKDQIESMAAEVIFGQLRLTIASLTIEEINQDRERFLALVRENIQPELQKLGLTLVNVNITDITDDSGYIESIGKKAASKATNDAKIAVAEQNKLGDIGEAEAERERRIQVAQYNSDAVEGENKSAANIAAYNADLAEKNAEAQRRAEIANQIADAKIQEERANAEQARLQAEEVVPREIAKRKLEIDSSARANQIKIEAEGSAAQMKIEAEARATKMKLEAEGMAAKMKIEAEGIAEKTRQEASGQADAIIAIKTAEAEGQLKLLRAKAIGYENLVKSCGGNTHDATTMLLVEKLEDIVKLQTEAIKNIKIDKITVWDSGSGEKGSSTANFMSNMVKSLPSLHDVAGMAGINLPEYLGEIKPEPKAAKPQPPKPLEK